MEVTIDGLFIFFVFVSLFSAFEIHTLLLEPLFVFCFFNLFLGTRI